MSVSTHYLKQIKTTAYHPQSNGSLERSHHSLTEYMKMFIESNDTYELIFGRLARLPSSEPLEPEEHPLHITIILLN